MGCTKNTILTTYMETGLKKLLEVSVSYFFVLIITLVLSTVFSAALMSIINKHNQNVFTNP